MLGEFSDMVPFVLAENHATEASRVTSRLVEMTLGRMVEVLTRFAISLSGETPTPVVLDRVSRAVLTALGDHGARYQSGLRSALAQEEALEHVGWEVARLVTAVEGASESQRVCDELQKFIGSRKKTKIIKKHPTRCGCFVKNNCPRTILYSRS